MDYPPLFAYFEWMLSQVAQFFDKEMLNVENLDYASPMTVIFQRLSVIVTDIVYALGVKTCLDSIVLKQKGLTYTIGSILLLANIGLLMVDHIHFQYNGLLFGIMLLSIGKILQEKFLQSAFYFAYLLHMKHIYIYIAPVYVVYLFKFYCLRKGNWFLNLLKLGGIVFGVSVASLGPFIKHIPQLLTRLFPFKRGLSHAYWAPNFWAIYNFIDKFLSLTLHKKTGLATGTGGLVKTYEHQVLPVITPLATFLITFLAMLPIIIKLATVKYDQRTTAQTFVKGIVLCACTSFLFGWHVHEKAILLILIPLSLLSVLDKFNARMTLFLGTLGYYSLFPLLFKPNLLFIKVGLFGAYTALTILAFHKIYNKNLLKNYEVIYLFGLLGLFTYENFFHYLLSFNVIFPFLPLMLTSVYCAVGVFYFWLLYYIDFIGIDSQLMQKTK